MKLLTLNIWGGHIRDPLLHFIESFQDIDVFCFQEVYHQAKDKIADEDRAVSLDIFSDLHRLLPQHHAFFRPIVNGTYGIGMFVKQDITVLEEGDVCIHHNPNYPGKGATHSRNLQWLHCQHNHKTYTIMNIHGLWNGKGKTDSPERISQSQKIKHFMNQVSTPHVVCGDFNLRPDTESMKIIEAGMNNLIQTHNILSTRTSYYQKEEKFADYILTSHSIETRSFNVLENEVSDHSPILLDFV